jgi:GT2 family glycosyltransferase
VQKPKVISAVINYNDIENTLICVESLLNQTQESDIVVWDNASTDSSVEKLKSYFGKKISIVASNTNLYWSPAVNKSLSYYFSNHDFVHYSNNDIYYPPESLERMIKDLTSNKAGMVGPTGSALGGLQDYAHHHSDDPRFHSIHDLSSYIKDRPATPASNICGASVLMSKKSYISVGQLDENMPLGADDYDISIRMKQCGFSIYVSEQCFVGHKGHASGDINPKAWDDIGVKSWRYFNNKWNGYFFNELESIKCLWEHRYNPGWDVGTGWLSEEDRLSTWEKRNTNYDGSKKF